MHRQPRFVLASASPRRVELLQGLGLIFTQAPQAIDESRIDGESIEQFVIRLALEKATAASRSEPLPVLGADTVVVIDGDALGKPADCDDAMVMLQQLSGREHQVMTAVAMVQAGHVEQVMSISKVTFRTISPEEALAYWHSGEPVDKAGGYAIQGKGAIFVSHLQGSYSGVMGLPLFETARLLGRYGIHCLE